MCKNCQVLCSSLCTVLFFQLHLLPAVLILHILVNRSNICTLLHCFVYNKVDQFCCSLLFRQLGAVCLLLIAVQFTMLLSMQLLTDLTFKSAIARIYCKHPSPAGAAAAAALLPPPLSSLVVVCCPSRFHMKPFIHYLAALEVIVHGCSVIAMDAV